MCTMYEKFGRLVSRMTESPLSKDRDFIDYCLEIHASPDSMDRMFSEQLGLSGEEFLGILLK